MDLFPLFSAVLVLAAAFAWLNHRFLRLPTAIGVMAMALAASLLALLLGSIGLFPDKALSGILERMEFRSAVLDVWLAFLLFAGALHVDLARLFGHARVIGLLATLGVLFTCLAVGWMVFHAAGWFGLELRFVDALLFGALIAPTDPIAVLGILRKAGAPRELEIQIVGESLFNDGVGVILFSAVLAVAGVGVAGDHGHGSLAMTGLFAWEVGGALALGLAIGYGVYRMLQAVEDAHIEVLLTFALACGLYSFAGWLHASGPLAVVVAGLFIGNSGRTLAMGEEVRRRVDEFWELVDEILNVLLFVLIGLEVLVLERTPATLALGVLAVPIVLLARFLGTKLLVFLLRRRERFPAYAATILTWGGLRGGISVALALSIPPEIAARDAILTATYVVVAASIIGQGLTIGPLVARLRERAT